MRPFAILHFIDNELSIEKNGPGRQEQSQEYLTNRREHSSLMAQ